MNSELLFYDSSSILKRCMMNFDQFVSEYIAEDHDIEQLSVMVLEDAEHGIPWPRKRKSKSCKR